MSRLLAKIMLAILMLPCAAMVYVITFVVSTEQARSGSQGTCWLIAGGVTSLFVGVYWFTIWANSVVWTSQRRLHTLIATLAAIGVGVCAGIVFERIVRGRFGYFVGTTLSPLIWLVSTIFIWRENSHERAERVKLAGADNLVCPVCSYNLTGLTNLRCPECGTQFTIGDLLSQQPGRAGAELES